MDVAAYALAVPTSAKAFDALVEKMSAEGSKNVEHALAAGGSKPSKILLFIKTGLELQQEL